MRMSQYMIGTVSLNFEDETNYPSTYEVSNHILLARIISNTSFKFDFIFVVNF